MSDNKKIIKDIINFRKNFDKDLDEINFISDEIDKHRRIVSSSLTPKGRKSKGYYETLQNLDNNKMSKREKQEMVNFIFNKAKLKNNDVYNQGEIIAIRTYKKHNNKKGLNLYGDPVRKRKR